MRSLARHALRLAGHPTPKKKEGATVAAVKKRRMDPEADIAMCLRIGLTGRMRKRLVSELNRLGIRPLSPNLKYERKKKALTAHAKFEEGRDGTVYCVNALDVLHHRLEMLSKNGL